MHTAERRILRRTLLLAVVTAAGLLAPLAGALMTRAEATTVVACPSVNLQTAIDAAPPNSTIVVSGTCTGQFRINKNLQLVGMPATLDGADGGTVVAVERGANVRLGWLTIQHGRGLVGGGVLNLGTLTLDNTTVTQSRAVPVYPLLQGNPLDCPTGCTTPRDAGIITFHNVGGGIANFGTLTLNASAVTQNAAAGDLTSNQYNLFTCGPSATCDAVQKNFALAGVGGGIFNNGQATLNSSTVSGNSAAVSGTATQTNSADCPTGCKLIQSNVLKGGEGGGIFNNGQATLVVNGGTISGNSVSSTLGSIENQTGKCVPPDCSQFTSITGGAGAGIFNDGTATINGSTLANNAGGDGGGILNDYGATATARATRIEGNSAPGGGGVWNGGTFLLQGGTVTRNTATATGGGVFVVNGGRFTQMGSTISGNTPDNCVGC